MPEGTFFAFPMAIKKSELYSSLWASCDELRGGMDASQYKDYVLVLLFIKYISDKFTGQPFAPIQIPAGASFADMVALKGKSDIGDQINKHILQAQRLDSPYKLIAADANRSGSITTLDLVQIRRLVLNIANQLPNNVYAIIVGGVLNAVLVPQLVRARSQADGGINHQNRGRNQRNRKQLLANRAHNSEHHEYTKAAAATPRVLFHRLHSYHTT